MCEIADRFYSAARSLAADGPIKVRLIAAYQEHLAELGEDQVPDSIRPKFESLREALHAVDPANGESAVHASVRKMSPVDAQRYATSILLMLGELVRVKGSGDRLSFSKQNRPTVDSEAGIPGVIQLRNNTG
jgi:hypothetical protein